MTEIVIENTDSDSSEKQDKEEVKCPQSNSGSSIS